MIENQEQFELGATKLSHAHACSAGAGWKWFSQGFAIFKKSPGLWMLSLLMVFVIGGICRVIPVIGEILSMIISPVLIGGIMMVSHRCYMEYDAEFNDLFSGFRYRLWPLVQVALLYLAGMCAAVVIAIVIGVVFMGADVIQAMGDSVMTMLQMPDPTLASIKNTPLATALDPVMAVRFMIMIMLMLMVWLPIMMMYYFAPVLVMFHDVDAFQAMKLSFMACWKNAMPFLIYGFLIMVFSMLSAFTLFLGLLVLIPVIWASTYVAYRDIFLSEEQELAA